MRQKWFVQALPLVFLISATPLPAVQAQTPTAATQRVGIPGSAALSPGAIIEFFRSPCGDSLPTSQACPSPPDDLVVTYDAAATADVPVVPPPANVDYDGSALTISVEGLLAVHVEPPDDSVCEVANNVPGTVRCQVAPKLRANPLRFTVAFSPPCRGGFLCPVTVTYPAGWNLAGVTPGTSITTNAGPLYTLDPSSGNYLPVPDGRTLQQGVGYWVYFVRPSPVALGSTFMNVGDVARSVYTIKLPAGRWTMVGNPFSVSVTVEGADAVSTFDAPTGYQAATVLPVGQGAWAYSATGGTLMLSPLAICSCSTAPAR